MKRALVFLAAVLLTTAVFSQPVKIMLVTGGHSYDTIQFFQMFDSFKNIEYKHFVQPEANKKLEEGAGEDFDVLVFYDMWKTISEKEKQAYIALAEKGKPMLFLHHALAAYPDWKEFENLVGGRYLTPGEGVAEEKLSTYKHDVWVESIVVKKHPVTKGLSTFKIFDEVYGNFWVSDKITPLLKTNHPESTETIAWENKFKNSNIIYIQGGHDRNAYQAPEFGKMIIQAINYLAAKK